MKKIVTAALIAASALIGFSGGNAVAEDGFSGAYLGVGLGWEWLENKGNVNNEQICKQKIDRLRGEVQLGYQKLFSEHFLTGLEFDCDFAKNEKNDLYAVSSGKISELKNKAVTPGIFAKFGYAWCDKYAVYTKLGVQWPGIKIENQDTRKGVFAAVLGGECKFTKKFSAFGEISYACQQKKDFENNGRKWSVKSGKHVGVNLGVTYHMLSK